MPATMLDSRNISDFVTEWMAAWNRHDLEGVLRSMAEDVVFEHWNGRAVRGKRQLERAWQSWFANHGDFHFEVKSIYLDQVQQTFAFEWRLDWPSPEPSHAGQREQRDGVDIIELRNGEIISKRTYTKTIVKIGAQSILLKA